MCRYAFVLSDANFERYGITAGDIRRVMVRIEAEEDMICIDGWCITEKSERVGVNTCTLCYELSAHWMLLHF